MQNELVRWAQRRIDSDVVVSASDFANACGDDDILADVVDSLKVRPSCAFGMMAHVCQPYLIQRRSCARSALQSEVMAQSTALQPSACVAASTTVSACERA